MPDDEMFRQGSIPLSEVIPTIKDALLRKDGIVEPDKQDLFREQISSTLNDTVVKQLATKTIVRINTSAVDDDESTNAEEDDGDDEGTDATEDEEAKQDDGGDDGEAEEDAMT